jgi:putative redox protein
MPSMSQTLNVTLPGKMRVVARVGQHDIPTDQSPQNGGDGFAPEPYDLFLASLGTCAGAYIASFCKQREIPTDGIQIVQSWERDEDRRLSKITLELELPDSFPEKYRNAVLRAAEQCSVKKALQDPPELVTRLAGTEG